MAPVDGGGGGGPPLTAAAAPSSPPRLVNVHTSGGAQLSTPTKSKSPNDEGRDDDNELTPETSPTSSNDAHTISSTSSDSGAAADNLSLLVGPNEGGVQAMDVTVTVLSLHGIVARPSKKEGKLSKRKAHGNNRTQSNPTATIVASFSQPISKDRVFLTHVPSSPVSLAPTTTAAGAGGGGGSYASTVSSNASTSSGGSGSHNHNESGNAIRPVVHWPTMVDVDEIDSDDGMGPSAALSTLQFRREFAKEGRGRFVPQACPVNLSISRNGKMALLGKANLIINGEERGEASLTVPITSSIRTHKSVAGRGVTKMRQLGGKKKEATTPTVKVSKGDGFQFGWEGDAMLRVLVNVSDPAEVKKERKAAKDAAAAAASMDEMEVLSRVSAGHDAAEDTLASVGECRERTEDDDTLDERSREELSVEGLAAMDDDDASLDQDDYYARMQRHMMENTEVRSLRQRLANVEHTNKVLQMELANARQEATIASENERECEEENDRLRTEAATARAELEQARANGDALRHDATAARTERELLPIYETRVSELLEELKRKDLEVQCLKEEIGELRGHYRDQLSDSFLWDDEDEEKERKPILPEALRKLTAFRLEEERNPNDLLWDKDEDVLEAPSVEKEGTAGAPADEAEEEGKGPIQATRGSAEGPQGPVDNFASILQGAKPIKEDSIIEEEEEEGSEPSPDAADDSAPNEESGGESEMADEAPQESTDETSSKKGWGVGRIGAGIMGLEERMRLRQQQFREQQQKLEGGSSESLRDTDEAAPETANVDEEEAPSAPAKEEGAAVAPEVAPTDDKEDEEEEIDSSSTAPEVDNISSIFQGVKPVKEDIKEEVESPSRAEETTLQEEGEGEDTPIQKGDVEEEDALPESPSVAKGDNATNEEGEGEAEIGAVASESSDEASPKKGWGVHRRIGAGIMSLEERMRLRQQKFREQQQKLEQEKQALEQAQPREPGLGGVIISRFSSHGSTGGQPIDTVDEGGDEKKEEGTEIEGDDNGGDWAETDDAPKDDSPNGEGEPTEDDELVFRKSSYNQVLLQESLDELERAVFSEHSSSAAPSSAHDDEGSNAVDVLSRISSGSSSDGDEDEASSLSGSQDQATSGKECKEAEETGADLGEATSTDSKKIEPDADDHLKSGDDPSSPGQCESTCEDVNEGSAGSEDGQKSPVNAAGVEDPDNANAIEQRVGGEVVEEKKEDPAVGDSGMETMGATSEKDASFIGTVRRLSSPANEEEEAGAGADQEFDEFIRVCSSDALDG